MDNRDAWSLVLCAFMVTLLISSVTLTTWRSLVAHQFAVIDDTVPEEDI